jgi:outer membrane protein TolC
MRESYAAGIAAVLLAVAVPRAAAPPLEVVAFDEAVARALANNRNVARAITAVAAAEARLEQARAVILPTVEAYVTETVVDEEQVAAGLVTQPGDQLAVGGLVTVPLLAASDWAARRQAADRVGVAALEAADVKKRVATATAQAYLTVIAVRRQLEVDLRARDNAAAQHEYTRTRLEAGAGTRLDASRAAEVLATNEVLVERSRGALALAQEALGLLMAADRPIDAGAEPIFEIPPEDAEPDLTDRTDLRLLSARADAADRVLRDSWKDWLPELVGRFEPRAVEPPGAFEDASTWRAVLAARIPIYLGGERVADRHLRQAEFDAARVDLDQAQLQARAETRAARIAIQAAQAALVHARKAAEQANEVLSITEVAFRAGARTNIELVDAQRRARDAETSVGIAEDILRQAKLDLLVALGWFDGTRSRAGAP